VKGNAEVPSPVLVIWDFEVTYTPTPIRHRPRQLCPLPILPRPFPRRNHRFTRDERDELDLRVLGTQPGLGERAVLVVREVFGVRCPHLGRGDEV
jgi:hypothetical protein